MLTFLNQCWSEFFPWLWFAVERTSFSYRKNNIYKYIKKAYIYIYTYRIVPEVRVKSLSIGKVRVSFWMLYEVFNISMSISSWRFSSKIPRFCFGLGTWSSFWNSAAVGKVYKNHHRVSTSSEKSRVKRRQRRRGERKIKRRICAHCSAK